MLPSPWKYETTPTPSQTLKNPHPPVQPKVLFFIYWIIYKFKSQQAKLRNV